MRFSKLRVTAQTREFIQEFGGLDRRPRIAENSFSDMRNLSSDQYPALAPRAPRGLVKHIESCNALLVKDELAYVSGNKLVYRDIEMPLSCTEDTPRQLVSMGAYIVVFPDAMYLNTANVEDRGRFQKNVGYGKEGELKVTLCEGSKEADFVSPITLSSIEVPLTPRKKITIYPNVTACDVTSGISCEIQGFPSPFSFPWYEITFVEGKNVTILPTAGYLSVSGLESGEFCTLMLKNLLSGDEHRVTLFGGKESGCVSGFGTPGHYNLHISGENTENTENNYYTNPVYLTNGSETIINETCLKIEHPCFVVDFPDFTTQIDISCLFTSDLYKFKNALPEGLVEARYHAGAFYVDGILRFSDKMITNDVFKTNIDIPAFLPKLDYVIEAKNRLWGCRYGADVNGNFVNEIYASKLGDFREWFSFGDVSTDSYTASVGTDGAFTGAINFRGYPLFFKENEMYKVYGEYPENFQIVSDTSMGVERGSERSLCVLSNTLYYKSPQGLFAYDGSVNTRIDAALGLDEYNRVVCGAARNKLWASMQCSKAQYSGIYVYDIEKGVWHREDASQMQYVAQTENDLLFVNENGELLCARGTMGTREAGQISFFAESGIIGYSTPDSKYVSRIALRMSVPHDGHLNLYIEYNSSNVWEFQGSIEGAGLGTFTLPIVPQRCDHFRVRFEGVGDCRVFGFSKVLENGGCV